MLFSSEPIRSRQNRTVVELAKLTDRRTREAVKLFRFDGVKLAEEAIASVAEIPQMFLRESEAETIVAALEERTGCSLAERVGLSRRRCFRPRFGRKIARRRDLCGKIY